MRFLAMEQELPGLTAADFAPHLEAEARAVWALIQAEVIRESYFAEPGHTAVLLLECADFETAHAYLNDLPLVKAGLITFEVKALHPYDGFARLFV